MTDFRIFKEFVDNNLKFDKKGRKISKWVEKLCEKDKLLVMTNFSFLHSIFKRRVLQTYKIQGLFGKGLTNIRRKAFENIAGIGENAGI